jgi:AraC-like DNA-binding protein
LLYLQRKPASPLDGCVEMLWYASTAAPEPGRQRILPTGSTQIILSLSRAHLLECAEGQLPRQAPPAQVVGARSTYEIIDNTDLACLIGLVFRPGGFAALVGAPADLFANRFVDLEDVWGVEARRLRDRLGEISTPGGRLACLEEFLSGKLTAGRRRTALDDHPAVGFALDQFGRVPSAVSVAQVARSTGWSARRFSQLFRERVGLTPKVWCRIQRFQRAVRQLHAGPEIRWGELALDCGYYDQSHFANEFRAFSGINISTYSAAGRTPWANHVVEGDPAARG